MEFVVPSGTIQSVKVYSDRSELTRSFVVNIAAAGFHNLIFKNLPQAAIEDSIRVSGLGSATICDVVVEQQSVSKDSNVPNEAVGELRKHLEALQDKQRSANSKLEHTQLQYDAVKNFSTNFSGTSKSSDDLNARLAAMKQYLAFSSSELGSIYEQIATQQKELEKLNAEIAAAEENLRRIDNPDSTYYRQVSVFLETKADAHLNVTLVYQVWQSGWSPKYDIRVSANDKRVDIGYYGQIWQNTGEDWKEAKIWLSTSAPAVGGDVPELEGRHVGIYVPPPPPAPAPQPRTLFGGAGMMPQVAMCAMRIQNDEMSFAVTRVEETSLTASFEIQRPTTIPSDGQRHKVTIGMFQLNATFEYHCVPKKAEQAYLTAKMVNTSDYPLLPGPSSIYLDGDFVANANLKAVSTNEEFSCSLGVDPSVRVVYKPLKKFEQQRGLLSKSNSCAFSQVTEVHNTRKIPVKILVVDQLPLSTIEKVKVTLTAPVIPPVDPKAPVDAVGPVKLNERNNIEFRDELGVNAKKQFEVKYVIDYPGNEQLNFW